MIFHDEVSTCHLSLDQACIFAPGADSNSKTSISGTFRVSFSRDAWIKNIHVRVRGLLKIPQDNLLASQSREMLTFEEEHMLASSKRLASFRVPAGVYEFPFTFPVPDCLLETITGAEHEYHSYQLQGVVERRVKRVVIVSQQIRIYRSPSFGSLDAFPWFPVIVEGFSDQNIQYQISLPSQNVPFGATFPVECWFAPHSEKTQARSLEIRLIEKHHLRFPATATESVRYNIHHVTSTSSHTIFAESFDLSDLESSHEIGWQVTKRMVLPRNFHHCTQSFFGRNIKIEHLLAITARFSGGNDQGAEIAETIPINVYMTPDSIGEDANVRSLDMRCSEGQASVPPPYGEHISDAVLKLVPGVEEPAETNIDLILAGSQHLVLPTYCE